VVEITEDGAAQHIEKLAKKYWDKTNIPTPAGRGSRDVQNPALRHAVMG